MFKSKFNLLYEQVMKSLITEAGIAIKDISPVKKENIMPSLELVQKEVFDPLGIPRESWDVIGSTGKKAQSGDLDIAIDLKMAMEGMGIEKIKDYVEKLSARCAELGWQYFDNMWRKGAQMFHIGVPIVNQDGEVAQVDIMASNNMDYTRFKYFSPSPEESKYKGAVRSMMMDVLIKISSIKCAEDATDEEKQPFDTKNNEHYNFKKYQYHTLEPDGLYKHVNNWLGKKGGILSTPAKISSEYVDNNIDNVIDILFDGAFKKEDFNSFESIWNNVLFSSKFPYKDSINDIVMSFIRRFYRDNSKVLAEKKLTMPEEVVEYAKKNGIDLEKLEGENSYTKYYNMSDAEKAEADKRREAKIEKLKQAGKYNTKGHYDE